LLGSILIIAGNQETVLEGTALLAVYAAGLAIPFMVLSVFIQFLLNFVKNARYVLKYVNPAAGILLIIVGLMLITDKFYLFMITG
jgi:cytochrome c-type biogenesis protein